MFSVLRNMRYSSEGAFANAVSKYLPFYLMESHRCELKKLKRVCRGEI